MGIKAHTHICQLPTIIKTAMTSAPVCTCSHRRCLRHRTQNTLAWHPPQQQRYCGAFLSNIADVCRLLMKKIFDNAQNLTLFKATNFCCFQSRISNGMNTKQTKHWARSMVCDNFPE
jgi:hypothetical protein